MKFIYCTALAAMALILGTQRSFAIADPAVLGAQIQPAPVTYPNGGPAYFQFQINNNGTTTSNSLVKVTISLVKLDFDDGTFDPTDIEQVAGTTPFTWSWDPTIKTMTGTLNGSFGQFTGNTFRIKNLSVLAAASMGTPNIGGNVNIVAPGPVNSSLTNDNTSAYTYSTSPLPVGLVNFQASANNCKADLAWTTSEERNFSHFDVECCSDGVNFKKIGVVKSTGKITGDTYSFSCAQETSKRYYRLRMVDFDGSYKISEVRSVTTSCGANSANSLITIAPNPAKGQIMVKGLSGDENVQIYNNLGQLMVQRKVTNAMEHVDVSNFAAGVYNVIVLRNNERISETKLVKD